MNIKKYTLTFIFALGILLPLIVSADAALAPPESIIKNCKLPDTATDADKAKITNIKIGCTDNYVGGGGWDAASATCPPNKTLIGTAYLPANHWDNCASRNEWGTCVGGTVLDKACYIQCAPFQSVTCS